MLAIHSEALPILIEGNKQVGWELLTSDFEFHAVVQTDGTINTYVNWGDDQPGDMANHADMEDAKRWLDTLLQASRR